jgi:hypothetical protein
VSSTFITEATLRKSTTPLTPAQVYRFAVDFCQPHLDRKPAGKVTATILLTLVFAAAARISSMSETCGRLKDVPCEDTDAKALYANLFCLEQLKRKANAAFRAPVPRALRRPRKHPLDSREISRSQAKAGTHSFFAYATASVMLHGPRFTLAVTPVTRSALLKDVLPERLAVVSKAGIKPGLWLRDRGFYSVAILRDLPQARRPVLMPVICHGRKANHPKGPSGSHRCKPMKTSGWFTHTLEDAKKARATVSICVKRTRWKDGHGRTKWDTGVSAYWGITPRRPDGVKTTYRKRFGIETRYRQRNQCRIRTTTKKFNGRCCYVAIGRLVRNLWVWRHHVVLSSRRRGCRRYNWELLRVKRLWLWLEQVAADL